MNCGKGRYRLIPLVLALALSGHFAHSVLAGETGHYYSGVEGIKAASLPPPGLYYRLYNVFYSASELTDKDGDSLSVGFDLDTYTMVHRLLWVTEKKLLGAHYATSLIAPIIRTDIELGRLGVRDRAFGLGDIGLEPLVLSWNRDRCDASFGLSLFLPTGKYDKTEPASPGKDFWTGMITLGGTYYLDSERTWSASILSRYEFHSRKQDLHVRPGHDFHFEWGIGKSVAKFWDVGLTGYCHWQVTDDRGSDVTWKKNVHDRVFAAGPEISAFIPALKCSIALRGQWEFGAVDRSEGAIATLVFTWIF